MFSSFGALVQRLRARRRLSQQALASALGVHRNTIGNWERGDKLPDSRAMVLELARALQLEEAETRQLLEASLTALAPYWAIPYLRNPFFTGREEILNALHTRLSPEQAIASPQPQALYGLGGSGKTQLAVEYVYRYALEYSAVFWIRAETVESIISSFLHIAEVLKLSEREEADHQRMVAAVHRWLSMHRNWLMVWDNLEDLELLSRFLPPTREAAILITTRRQAFGTVAQGIELSPMDTEEGTLLLLRRAKIVSLQLTREHLDQLAERLPTDYAAARTLAIVLGGLPLALDQVGAYIEETGCSLAAYLRRYEAQRRQLLNRRGVQAGEHPQSVTATFLVASQRLEWDHPAAADLLSLCAFLYAEAIPEELFVVGAPHLGPRLAAVAADPYQLDLTLAALRTFSLIQRHAETQTLSLHRLVQAVMRDRLDAAQVRQWMERVVRAVNVAFPEPAFAVWPQCERLVPHVQVCRSLIEDVGISIPEAAHVLHKAGHYLTERGRYTEAGPFLEQAVALQELQAQPDQLELATALNHVGMLYWNQGKYEHAETVWQRALVIFEQQVGPDHPSTADSLNYLGMLYWNQGKYEHASSLWQRALLIREQRLGPDHPDTADSLNNVGFAFLRQEQYEQAEPVLRRALAIFEQQVGPDHPMTITSLVNVGNLYRGQGKYEQAEQVLQRALASCEKQAGPDRPVILRSLGTLYQAQRKYEQAEPVLQRALAIREEQVGPEHPLTAAGLVNLGDLYQEQEKYEQAEPLYRRALQIWEAALGSEHPRVAAALAGLASLYAVQERYGEAEPLYQRGLAIREKQLGQHHLETARNLAGLARLYTKQAMYEQAEPLLQRAWKIFEQHLGSAHPETVKVLNDYRRLLERRGAMRTLIEKQQHQGISSQGSSHPGDAPLSAPSAAVPPPSGLETDPLEEFLADCCDLHPRAWSLAGDLWQAYEQWTREHGERFPLSRRAFIARLKAHGCRAGRTNAARIWRGIAIASKGP